MKTPYVLRLVIIGLPKRYNTISGTHWSLRAKEARKWHQRLLGRMITQRISPPRKPLARAKLRLTRYSSRPPDYDGLVQSFKPVVDALIKTLIIADDNMEVVGKPEYNWERVPANEGKILIEVEEIQTEHPKLEGL